MGVSDAKEKDTAKSNPVKDDTSTKGCAPSFLTQERGESGGTCRNAKPDPEEEYVQPDSEKEVGGEG